MREWQARMLLGHWDIRVRFDVSPGDENEAEIKVHDYYEQASIRISPGHGDWSDEWGEAIIVHELCHVIEKRVRSCVDAACDGAGRAGEIAWSWYLIASEQMVEAFSRALVSASGKTPPPAPPAKAPEGAS